MNAPTNNSRVPSTIVNEEARRRERSAERTFTLSAINAILVHAPALIAAATAAVEKMEEVEARRRARQGGEESEAETRLRVAASAAAVSAINALAPVVAPALARAVEQAAREESELDAMQHRVEIARARRRAAEAEREAAKAEEDWRAQARATDDAVIRYARMR